MNTITTRSIAALAATGALVAGGAAAASATGDGDHRDGEKQRSEVSQLVHDAVKDGTVTVEEETAIKQAIEDHTDVEFESLEDAAPVG
jgi:dienelactone hydrolase